MLHEFAVSPPDDMPAIGSKHIHKGGNIWQIIRYAKVSVTLPTTTVDKGLCVFLICKSSETGKPSELHWRRHEFLQDFEPL